MDEIEEFVYGCGCGQVADVNSAAGGVIGGIESGREGRSRVVARRREANRGRSWGVETLLLCSDVSVFKRIRRNNRGVHQS